jgi:phosphate ABC transporter phosphate-binding protein
MRNRVIACAAAGGIVLVAAGAAMAAGNYQVAGSTLVEPAFNAWCTHIGGNFCSDSGGGSGAGITDFVANTVDWADSDAPLSPANTGSLNSSQPGAGVRYFVTLIGGIAVPTHFNGETKAIKLTGPVIADIFDGSVTKWNASQITKLNKGVKFPSSTIVECVRGDSSGTSYNFTNYLATASPSFKKKVGPASKTPNWGGTHTTFGTGNGAEASCIQGTSNAIGYVDFANTVGVNNYLSAIGHVVGKKTYYTTPSIATIAAAAAQAAHTKVSLTNPITLQNALLDTKASNAYPISLTSFLLAYKDYAKVHAARESASAQWTATKKFINYAISPTGQKQLKALHFATLPAGWINLDKGLEKTVKP